MYIKKKHAEIIIESLKWSIYNIREAHQTKYKDIGFDYEKNRIEPIQEVLAEIKSKMK